MKVGCSHGLDEVCDLTKNIHHPIRIVKAWGVDECTQAAIGFWCGPIMDSDPRRLGRDLTSDFDSLFTSDELDKLFVE